MLFATMIAKKISSVFQSFGRVIYRKAHILRDETVDAAWTQGKYEKHICIAFQVQVCQVAEVSRLQNLKIKKLKQPDRLK